MALTITCSSSVTMNLVVFFKVGASSQHISKNDHEQTEL